MQQLSLPFFFPQSSRSNSIYPSFLLSASTFEQSRPPIHRSSRTPGSPISTPVTPRFPETSSSATFLDLTAQDNHHQQSRVFNYFLIFPLLGILTSFNSLTSFCRALQIIIGLNGPISHLITTFAILDVSLPLPSARVSRNLRTFKFLLPGQPTGDRGNSLKEFHLFSSFNKFASTFPSPSTKTGAADKDATPPSASPSLPFLPAARASRLLR